MAYLNKDDLPQVEDVSSELRDALIQRNRLSEKRNELKERTETLRAQIRAGLSGNNRNERVAAILSGQKLEPSNIEKDLAVAYRELSDLNEAIEANWHQIQSAERKASVTLCDSVRNAYEGNIRDWCAILAKAHQCNKRHFALVGALTDRRASTSSLPTINAHLLEHPTDPYSRLGYFFREALDQGIIKQSDIPAELRQ